MAAAGLCYRLTSIDRMKGRQEVDDVHRWSGGVLGVYRFRCTGSSLPAIDANLGATVAVLTKADINGP